MVFPIVKTPPTSQKAIMCTISRAIAASNMGRLARPDVFVTTPHRGSDLAQVRVNETRQTASDAARG